MDETRDLFSAIAEVELDDALRNALEENLPLAQGSNTEKARSELLYAVTAPVVVMVEAEENLVGGLGQCLAERVAARDFNVREESPSDVIYGAVTTGTAWKFLQLRGDDASIDRSEYHVGHAGKILGVLLHMVA